MKKLIVLVLFVLGFVCQLRGAKLQLGANIRHDGQTSDSVVLDTLLWQRQLSPFDILSGPVTIGLRVIVPSLDGLWCLTTNGDSLWVADSGFAFYGTPAVIGNNRIVVVREQTLVCYDFNGQELWQVSGFPAIPSHPAVSGDTIFVTSHKKVYALDSTGNSLWVTTNLPFPMSRNMTVAISDSWIVAATVRGLTIDPTVTVALISRDGRVVDSRGYGNGAFEGGGCCSPTISENGDIQLSNSLGGIYGYWRAVCCSVPLPDQRWRVAGGSYYGHAATRDSLIFWPGNGLTAISLSGQIRWTASTDRISFSSLLIDALGKGYVGTDVSELLKIDLISGLIQRRFRCGNAPLTAPASFATGELVIADTSGQLFCFGPTPVGLKEESPTRRTSIRPGVYDASGRRVSENHLARGVYIRVDASGSPSKSKVIVH